MTADTMDKVLKKFEVVMYDPIGEKFDANLHEAMFVIPWTKESEIKPDHIGNVM